jgi:hypothetical protein
VFRHDAGNNRHARKVAVGTISEQIKALLARAGAKRQIELLASQPLSSETEIS